LEGLQRISAAASNSARAMFVIEGDEYDDGLL
jgi:hypothetical protein